MSRKKATKAESIQPEKKFEEGAWRNALESMSINDPHWWCIVTMMVETVIDHSRIVSIFNDVAENGKRRTIYALSREKALSSVKTLSKAPFDKYPVAQHVCHHASKFLQDNESLPTWLMAWVVKYLIYRAKVEMINRIKMEAELEWRIDEEYRIMQTVDTAGLSKGGPSRGGGGAQGMTYLKGKANTRLRRRDEEWRDVENVDDAPLGGANLYIVLTGFYDPDLPAELVSVGVPLTCVLRIKRPSEKLERPAGVETNHEDSSQPKKLPFFSEQTVGQLDLYRFWTFIEKDLLDPAKMTMYSEIVFLTFCPPILPECNDDEEDDDVKNDVYDRVSYIVYDLYDLLINYSDYLKNMKIVNVHYSEEQVESEVYRTVLDAIPTECVFVSTILYAMVLQVEANVQGNESDILRAQKLISLTIDSAEGHMMDEVEKESSFEEIEHEDRDAHETDIQEKLRQLDDEYEHIEDNETDTDIVEVEIPKIQLILHNDTLRKNTYHVQLDENFASVIFPHETFWAYATLQILEANNICNIWNYCEFLQDSRKSRYAYHLKNLLHFCNPEREIDVDSIVHYLHMTVLDKMIHDRPVSGSRVPDRREDTSQLSDFLISADSESSAPRINNRSKSEPLLSTKLIKNRQAMSDGNVIYNNPIPKLTDAWPLFRLTDMREALAPGYLQKNVFDKRRGRHPRLEEHNDVEFLPKEIFVQTLDDSIQTFDCFDASYVEPTDTVLLYFSNNHTGAGVHLNTRLSSIRTPVSFREFAKYIVVEEAEWISGKSRPDMEVAPELTKSPSEAEMLGTFGDEHFILPGSLKAADLMKSEEVGKQRKQLEATDSAHDSWRGDEGRERKTVKEDAARQSKEAKRARAARAARAARGEGLKGKAKGGKKAGGSVRQNDRQLEIEETECDTSFLPPRKILTFECAGDAEPYEFLGYDLGRFRVQVVSSTKKLLSADGTLVEVELEEWLYRRTDLRITVALRGCRLCLLRNVLGQRPEREICHFTTSLGIVFAFERSADSANERTSKQWQRLDFDFRASWPSGLFIEPTTGDGPENPFYIRQSYISKGPECADIIHEVSRKFLRNGTVLKYMADGSIIVLRPNGDVITCTEFNKANFRNDVHLVRETNEEAKAEVNRGSISSKNGRHPTKVNKTKAQDSQEASRVLSESVKRRTSPTKGRVTVRPSDLSTSEEFVTAGVSRYTVLCYDGRHYEVFNDLVVREHDRLLVRTASDYEVDEKFTRRADGTDMLLNSNGELVVNFTDGTRITTGYAIEEDPIISEWTEEEFYYYFQLGRTYENENVASDTSLGRPRLVEGEIGSDEDAHEIDMMTILISDAFVSVLLTCRMEHKNYATVAYDQTTVNCTLSTPGDLRVSISRRGHYEVSMAAEVNLEINTDRLIFSNDVCASCGGKSVSTYVFPNDRRDVNVDVDVEEGRDGSRKSSRTIFTTVDVFGNVFEVKDDGMTRYRRGSRMRRQENSEAYESEHVDEGGLENEGNGEFNNIHRRSTRISLREDGKCCERSEIPRRNQQRIFAMNRDLSGHEYLDRSAKREHEVDAVFGEGASAIVYPISRRPQLHRLITFLPLQSESRSKALLLLRQDAMLRPTNHDRSDFIRSTYAIPYHWLFPYGKNGKGIWKNTHNVPLNQTIERYVPKVLAVRVLHKFIESDRNAVVDLQAALGRYWMSIAKETGEYHELGSVKETKGSFIEDDDAVKMYLYDIAMGKQAYIDLPTYESGLLKHQTWTELKLKREYSSKRLDQYFKQRESMKNIYEWYKECLRQKYILPYFENVTGSCFLLVQSSVEKAINLAETLPPASSMEIDQYEERDTLDL